MVDFPIALLSEFTKYAETKEFLRQRVIQVLTQFLYDNNIVENEAVLNHNLTALYEQPLQSKQKLQLIITNKLLYAKIYFVLCVLLFKFTSEAENKLNQIVDWIYFYLNFYSYEKQQKLLITYDTELNIIINYEVFT